MATKDLTKKTIVLLGAGNLGVQIGAHLLKNKQDFVLKQWYNRSFDGLLPFQLQTQITDDETALSPADVYLVCLKDDVMDAVVARLNIPAATLVLHTSGMNDLHALQGNFKKGVFYPLQTFNKNKFTDFSQTPFMIEATDSLSLSLVESLARCFTDLVYRANSKQRAVLHLSAVLVNNFTNHLYHIASDVCNEHQVDFNALLPILSSTASRVAMGEAPQNLQSGPAVRGDLKTMKKHLKMLDDEQRLLYQMISDSILKKKKDA